MAKAPSYLSLTCSLGMLLKKMCDDAEVEATGQGVQAEAIA